MVARHGSGEPMLQARCAHSGTPAQSRHSRKVTGVELWSWSKDFLSCLWLISLVARHPTTAVSLGNPQQRIRL